MALTDKLTAKETALLKGTAVSLGLERSRVSLCATMAMLERPAEALAVLSTVSLDMLEAVEALVEFQAAVAALVKGTTVASS